ncbi:hypothetical protein KQI84_06040 [bacterium]|nr:hypothetical protein [bacterium]
MVEAIQNDVRSGPWPFFCAVAAYIVLSVIFLQPYIDFGDFSYSLQSPDGTIAAWAMGWGRHAVLTDPVNYFEANVFYPQPHALAYTDHFLMPALLTLPFTIFTDNPVLPFNALFFMAFVLNGFCAFLCLYKFTRQWLPSFLAGFIFTFSPVMIHHTNGQIHLLCAWWLPLSLFALARFLDARTVARWLVLFGSCLGGVLTGWYMALLLVFTMAIIGLPILAYEIFRRNRRAILRLCAAAGAVALALIVSFPLAIPYLQIAEGRPQNAWSTLRAGSGQFYSYALPPASGQEITAPGALVARVLPIVKRIPYPQHLGYSLSLVAAILLVGVMWLLWRRARGAGDPPWVEKFETQRLNLILLALLLLLGGIAASLGPFLGVRSRIVFLPYSLALAGMPQISFFRAPFRYNLLAALALGMLLGLALSSMKKDRSRNIAGVTLLLLALVEFFPIASETGAYHYDWQGVRPFYKQVADDDSVDVVLELPATVNHGMIYSLQHLKPLYNAASGYDPASYFQDYLQFNDLPDRTAVWLMNERGLRNVVVHDDATSHALSESAYFELAFTNNGNACFQLSHRGLAETIPAPSPAPRSPLVYDFAGTDLPVTYVSPLIVDRHLDDSSGFTFKVRTHDPSFVLPQQTPIDGDDYRWLEVEARLEMTGVELAEAELYWADRSSDRLGERRKLTYTVPADSEWHRLRIDLYDSFQWRISHGIHTMRFDPVTAFPAEMSIRRITLVPAIRKENAPG